MKTIALLILLVFVINNSLYALESPESDYEFICNAFKENINSADLNSLTREEKIIKINEIIWDNIKTQEARDILSAVAQASPDKKYSLFKQAVEISTGKKWDCPAIRDY